MDYVNIPDKLWTDLLTEKIKPELQSLALKVLLSRLIVEIKTKKTADVSSRCLNELKDFSLRNSNLPSLQKDLQMITTRYSYKSSLV
jgi:hypothetical protein